MDDDKLYWCVSSPTMKDKPVTKKYIGKFKIEQYMQAHFLKVFLKVVQVNEKLGIMNKEYKISDKNLKKKMVFTVYI